MARALQRVRQLGRPARRDARAPAPARVAVIVEPATRPHPPLLMAAYGLTAREQDVTRSSCRASRRPAIAERLVVAPHTVQEHLKSIFEKTGVRKPPRSRGQGLLQRTTSRACATTSVGWWRRSRCVGGR